MTVRGPVVNLAVQKGLCVTTFTSVVKLDVDVIVTLWAAVFKEGGEEGGGGPRFKLKLHPILSGLWWSSYLCTQ